MTIAKICLGPGNHCCLVDPGPFTLQTADRVVIEQEGGLKLGKVVGVPTMGAVIATGSYTLADGSSIRTPGSGVWTASGENMENFGVKPDVYVDNTPEDFFKGSDAQIEKAVELLKVDIAAGKKK